MEEKGRSKEFPECQRMPPCALATGEDAILCMWWGSSSGGNDTRNVRGLNYIKVIYRSKNRLREHRSKALGSTESSRTLRRGAERVGRQVDRAACMFLD